MWPSHSAPPGSFSSEKPPATLTPLSLGMASHMARDDIIQAARKSYREKLWILNNNNNLLHMCSKRAMSGDFSQEER